MSVVAPPEGAEAFLPSIGWNARREQDLETFRTMLQAANADLNLVAPGSLADFRSRHFIDSAQLLWFAPRQTATWADLGSGAGLPGLVLAIALKGRPGARVHLVESTTKKCRFLDKVASALALPVVVHNARAEALDLEVEIVTARACAPLTRLLDYAQPYLDRGARGLFLKGEGAAAEITEARKAWRFTWTVQQSLSDRRGGVISLADLARAR